MGIINTCVFASTIENWALILDFFLKKLESILKFLSFL